MNLDLAITYAPQSFPQGTVLDHVHVAITGSNGVSVTQDVAPATASVEFANVAADTYTFSVQGIDPIGVALGSAVTGSFTVVAPTTITLNLPSAVVASQS